MNISIYIYVCVYFQCNRGVVIEFVVEKCQNIVLIMSVHALAWPSDCRGYVISGRYGWPDGNNSEKIVQRHKWVLLLILQLLIEINKFVTPQYKTDQLLDVIFSF